MKRRTHKLNIALRKFVLRLILLVPARWRSALAKNAALTKLYLYFDRAKYADYLSSDAYLNVAQPVAKEPPQDAPPPDRPVHIPIADYDYFTPELTAEIKQELARLDGPLISIIMPVYDTPAEWLRLAIESVQSQWYPKWELCIVDDHSSRPETIALLKNLSDPRIHVRRLARNAHIVGASNEALSMASGEYIALLDHDDELTPDALYRIVKVIQREDADLIYSDEDKIDEQGHHCDVYFKPDFSPEQFLAHNYLCHLTTIRRSLVMEAGGFSPGTDGAQDYDLFLKVAELTDRIVHIPRVLYHWRKVPGSTAMEFNEKDYAQDAGQTALENAIRRRGIDAVVGPGDHPGNYRVRYAIAGEPLVSIVIPFKDRPDLLNSCLKALVSKSTYPNFEIIGVSNNSEESATRAAMQRWAKRDRRVRFIEHNTPFNFSELNNVAVAGHVRGEHVVMMNNDVEIITPEWIESLLEFSQRPDVGVVGARLYYPDGRLQHAGVILGMGGVAGHYHKLLTPDSPGYFARPRLVQNLTAVTAACCMVKTSIYQEVGGLDEEVFRIAFNDVDFCMRVRHAGYLNVYTPYCEAVHHESISRGYEDTPEKQARFISEVNAFRARYRQELAAGDPYFNPNFALMTAGELLLSGHHTGPAEHDWPDGTV